MLRKSIVLLTVFAFVFGAVGVAMAANRVEVKVTSEPIPLDSECSKAGGFSLEFDEDTELRAGDPANNVSSDVITIDTDFGTTLCESFDIMIAPANDVVLNPDGTYASGTLWTAANTPLGGQGAFTQTTATTITGSGVVFRLQGLAGTQRITLTVLGPAGNSITVNDVSTTSPDVVTLNFLDEKTNATGANPAGPETWNTASLWEVGGTANTYSDAADWDDNTLCLNVSSDLFTKTVVNASMDSRADKYTFIPSNPQIAHIAAPLNVVLFACEGTKDTPGAQADNIVIPDEQGNCGFDYEMGTGYCTGNDLGRRVVFDNLSGVFDSAQSYSVRLEILSPSTGVYWSNTVIGYETQITTNCPALPDFEGEEFFPTGNAFNRNGNLLTNFTGASPVCGSVAAANRATTIVSGSATIFSTAPNSRGLYIDMPSLVFDRTVVEEGTQVEVRATLTTFPCGTITSAEIDLGTFGCDTDGDGGGPDGNGGNYTMIYPYFTALDSAVSGWWNGIVVTNLSSEDGDAMFYLYEADGDQATLTVPVAANSQLVTLLEPTLDSMTITENVDGTLGNSSAYIVVCTPFMADGFAMIASNSADENGSESMGYLPRFERAMGVCNP